MSEQDDFDGIDPSPEGWEEIGHLDAGQYWRLEAHQLYIQQAKDNAKIKNLMHTLLVKDKQLLDIKINNMQKTAVDEQNRIKDKQEAYNKVKQSIEREVGIEFKDVVIDDATYAIRREIDAKINGGGDSQENPINSN